MLSTHLCNVVMFAVRQWLSMDIYLSGRECRHLCLPGNSNFCYYAEPSAKSVCSKYTSPYIFSAQHKHAAKTLWWRIYPVLIITCNQWDLNQRTLDANKEVQFNFKKKKKKMKQWWGRTKCSDTVFFQCIISIYQLYRGIRPEESGECCWLIELFVEVLIMPSFHEMLVARAKPDNEYSFTYTELWYQASTTVQKKGEGSLGILFFLNLYFLVIFERL